MKRYLLTLSILLSTSTFAAQVQVTSMDDVAFGSASSVPSASTFDICVGSKNTNGGFSIKANSSYPSGTTYRMKASSTYMNYTVEYCKTSACSYTALSHNVAVSTTGGNNTLNCSGGVNYRFRITIDGTSFGSAITGAYSDTLTVLIGQP